MAFNKKNFYLKVLQIQKIALDYQEKGASKEWIYKNMIEPNYYISQRSFYLYLTINARKEIKLVESRK